MQHVSVADREHFLSQRASAADLLLISKPLVDRSSRRLSIQLTRKIISPGGGFGGVVVLSVDCFDLSGFYQSLHLRHGFIALAGLDGVIRARGPVIPGAIGATVATAGLPLSALTEPAGTTHEATGALGGPHDKLTVSFRRLRAYPLVVLVAFSDKQTLTAYRHVRLELVLFGSVVTVVSVVLGVIWVRQRKRSLASQAALTATLENMNGGLVMVDAAGQVRVVNSQALQFLGLPAEMLSSLRRAASPGRMAAESAVVQAIHRHFPPGEHVHRGVFAAGGLLLEGVTSEIPGQGTVHVMTDVTGRHLADARIRHLALHDPLTGLGNRVALAETVDRLIESSQRSGAPFALLLLNLDGFKLVNDTFGHDTGDALLIEVAGRLTEAVADPRYVARSGGDEFAMLCCGGQQPAAAFALAADVTERLSAPFGVIAGQELRVSACIGLVLYPDDTPLRADLMQQAGLALDAAKKDRSVRLRRFQPAMAEAVQDRFRLVEDLRAAVGTAQIYLDYQPQFNTASLDVVGFEALARWNHPERGMIPPDQFISLAEETGLIVPLCRTLVADACRQAMTWPSHIRLGLNVSPVQVRDSGFPDVIADVLAQTGLPPGRLELEVTEGVLIADERLALATLTALRSLGVGLALDDFGTGYASLSYLRKFPFERIKLDRSFVQAQVGDPRSRHILESILSLGRNLGLGVIAEGVESKTQLALLRQQRCQEIQGFLVGKPMPGPATLRLVPQEMVARVYRLPGQREGVVSLKSV